MTISRRSFLKGGALAGAAGALASMGLVGCSSSPSETKTVQTASGGSATFDVHQADILVVGGGAGGTFASQVALTEGRQVTIIDKGSFRHNGASGMCWDALCFWPPAFVEGAMVTSQVDQVTRQKAIDWIGGMDYDPRVSMINHGQTFPDRSETGDVQAWFDAMPRSAKSGFFRREMDSLYENGVTIMDQFMVTDLLANDTRCWGVLGIHLPTGTYRVIRANAVVLAATGCPQFHGWLTTGYRGINSSDATGDLVASAFRHGLTIGEAEWGQYDINSVQAPDVGCTYGCGIGADAADPSRLLDVNKNPIFAEGEEVGGNMGLAQRVGRIVYEDGLGTEHNGVLVHYGEFQDRWAIMRNVEILKNFNVDPVNDYVECVPEMFDQGASTVVDETMMTEWEGLFNVRGAGVVGEQGGPMTFNNLLYGPYTGHCAAQYAKNVKPLTMDAIDWTPVEEEISRLEEIRTRSENDSLRPYEVRRKIQEAGYHGFDVYRSTSMMEEAIAELERIRKEDIPRMVLADDTRNFNVEWKTAIENYNMLDIAEVSIRASLMREETRGCYLRPEFPEKDDENWNCMIACQMRDGEITLEKRELTKVDA